MRTGRRDRAQELLAKLGDGEGYGAPRALAIFHVLCGETEKAAGWIEKAIGQRDVALLPTLRVQIFKDLRSSSRWPALAKMMNLPEAS